MKIYILTGLILLVLCVGFLTLPAPNAQYSKVLYASDGRLLSARISGEDQWRFPKTDTLPKKYIDCLIEFEDKRFWYHPGVDPIAIFRAIRQNIKSNDRVSGGSTLTMQTIRLQLHHPNRTIYNKVLEIFWSVLLDIKWKKERILDEYASMAPYGANVVGIEAACWRYFEKPSGLISWAEAACLAVLPNSPALIHPGRNRTKLKEKRDGLLLRLLRHHKIDSITYDLSIREPLPEAPKPLNAIAPHALDYLSKTQAENGKAFPSTIQFDLQESINRIAAFHSKELASNYIDNLAILVVQPFTGKVLAYCGNAPETRQGNFVDHVQAPRSTGSILKPILYAAALYKGIIYPNTLLEDIPMVLNGYQPQNFSLHYSGLIPANQALSQSLNIPFVKLLQSFGQESFLQILQRLNFSNMQKPASHYGLTLILGGAESSLWEITGAYSSLNRILLHYGQENHSYYSKDIHPLILLKSDLIKNQIDLEPQRIPPLISAGSIKQTFEAMKNLKRPDEYGHWNIFQSGANIAWKTGTSYGFRDAWAVGLNPEYTVGIWVGNSSGEGRPGLLGVKVAAPILFDVFAQLPSEESGDWDGVLDELDYQIVCHQSGMKAKAECPVKDTILVSRFSDISSLCPYHQNRWVNKSATVRVKPDCVSPDNLSQKSYFILHPVQEYYYSRLNPDFEKLPPWMEGCIENDSETAVMQILFPANLQKVYLPKESNGTAGELILKIAHHSDKAIIYWHLDQDYLGQTEIFHEISIKIKPGIHTLLCVDNDGHEIKKTFEVIN